MSQHRKLTLEKKILPQGFEPATFQSRVRRSNRWAIPWQFHGHWIVWSSCLQRYTVRPPPLFVSFKTNGVKSTPCLHSLLCFLLLLLVFIFLHLTKTFCRKRLCLIVPCISSYRWVQFPRSVLKQMVVNPSKSVPVESCQPRHSHTNQPTLAVISVVFYKNCEFRHFVQQRSDIGECNGRKHHWQELPEVYYFCHDKRFVATNTCFSQQNKSFVATKVRSSRQNFSRAKRVFVLSRQKCYL